MSRTQKGKKAPGSEFWGKRPKTGKNSKRDTHRAERQQGKKEAKGK